jgi:hypothetical protein
MTAKLEARKTNDESMTASTKPEIRNRHFPLGLHSSFDLRHSDFAAGRTSASTFRCRFRCLTLPVNTARVLFIGLLLLGIGRVLAQSEPWVHPDGSIHYYTAVAAPAGIGWSAASDSAQRPGGYLATITSQAENDFVFALVDSSAYWFRRPDSSWAGPWLGGKQPFGAPEPDSGWEWIDGEPFSYSNWTPGEPDNQGSENALNFGESASGRIPTWNDLSEEKRDTSCFLNPKRVKGD